jgi:hypothetical protein
MSLNLKPNHLLTVGAVIFAGYALYETLKKPGGTVASAQPGQAQRDTGLTSWLNLQDFQTATHAAEDSYSQLSIPSNFGGVTP